MGPEPWPQEEVRWGRGGYRAQFVLAWVFLVIVVACAFFVQARTINELHDTQDVLRELVDTANEQRVADIEALCRIQIRLHSDEKAKVFAAFEKAGLACEPNQAA
jgi:hypothetical protein